MARNISRSRAIRDIAGLDYDSRRVKPGWCFVAMRGESTDGNRYIDSALKAGAVAIVSDSLPPRRDIPWAQVQHGRRALARLSANFYGRPAEKLASPASPAPTARPRRRSS